MLLCFVSSQRCHALCFLNAVTPEMLSCFVFFECYDTAHLVCSLALLMCTLAHNQKKRLCLKTRPQATSFTPAWEEVEGVLASPRQTLLKASHLDLGQALYLDSRHTCLVVELAAIETLPTKTNPDPRTLTNRSWHTQMFSQSRNRSYATISLVHNYQQKPSERKARTSQKGSLAWPVEL